MFCTVIRLVWNSVLARIGHPLARVWGLGCAVGYCGGGGSLSPGRVMPCS
jgi:hypothetical protein